MSLEALTFGGFKDGIGGRVCQKLGIAVAPCASWGDLREKGRTEFEGGRLTGAGILQLGYRLPSDEYMVLQAVLYALGLVELAEALNKMGYPGQQACGGFLATAV